MILNIRTEVNMFLPDADVTDLSPDVLIDFGFRLTEKEREMGYRQFQVRGKISSSLSKQE